MIKKYILLIILVLFAGNLNAETKTYKMVFVPASEKGDESDYTSLIAITEKLTGLNIDTIKVTDYNAAVEAMRAGRAHIAWYGGKTYVKAAEIANKAYKEDITLKEACIQLNYLSEKEFDKYVNPERMTNNEG